MKRYLKKNAVSIVSGVLALVAMWLVWLIAEKTVSNEYVVPPDEDYTVYAQTAPAQTDYEEIPVETLDETTVNGGEK
jgi:hypothetical protein